MVERISQIRRSHESTKPRKRHPRDPLRVFVFSWRIVLVGWLLIFGTSGVARATVLVPGDLGELAREARAIARGRIVAVDAQWTDGRRTIETLVTLEAETYLKGRLGDTVQFRVPGGTFGRFRSIVVGAPQFAVGQRVIIFLGARGPTVPYVLGFSQGVFRIAQTSDGEWMVTPPPILPTMQGPIVRGNRSLHPAPLAEFERDVRALAGAP